MALLHSLDPLWSRLRPRFGLSNSFKDCAVRSWVLCTGDETTSPSALFEADDLQKIQGVAPDSSSLSAEMQRVQGGPTHHFATTAYELRNATLLGGQLFTREVYCRLSDSRGGWWAKPSLREYSEAVLASSHYGIKYFGHWMNDDLPKLLAARELGSAISTLTEPTPAQQDYLRLLDLQTPAVSNAYFRRIVVIDDVGQNAYKRERIARLRAAAQRFGSVTPVPGIMLLRGRGGSGRTLLNESEVARVARGRGFHVVDPATMGAEQLLRLCIGCPIVLGVEGSQMANGLMWMSSTGSAVVIQPPKRFTMVLKAHCDAVGIRFAFIVADPTQGEDFILNIAALQRVLDRIS